MQVRAHFCTFEQRKWYCFGANSRSLKHSGLRTPGKTCWASFYPQSANIYIHEGTYFPGYKAKPLQDQGVSKGILPEGQQQNLSLPTF